MKGKIIHSRGNAPPVLALVALLLALGVAATVPMAFTNAKYVASAKVDASAQVAKWAPDIGGEMAGTQPIAIYIRRDDTAKYTDYNLSRTVVYDNSGSEVMARFSASLDIHGYTWLGSSVPASADVAPGGSTAAGSLTMGIYNWAMFNHIAFGDNIYMTPGRYWYCAPVRSDYGGMAGMLPTYANGPSSTTHGNYLQNTTVGNNNYFVRRMNGYAPSQGLNNVGTGNRPLDVGCYSVNTASCTHYFDFDWSATQVD